MSFKLVELSNITQCKICKEWKNRADVDHNTRECKDCNDFKSSEARGKRDNIKKKEENRAIGGA